MPQGWIKLHRKLSKKAFYNKPNYLALWVHLLLSANHEEKEFLWNGSIIKVQKGQFITGRKQLSEQAGIPETTVERLLTFFEKEQQIGQQKTSKYRLITIYKWHEYQIMDNKRTTGGQQADTNKNEKKEKNISKTKVLENMSGFNTTSDDYLEGDIQIDPDFSPKGKKKKVADEIQQVFDLFNNPAKAIWRLREIERESAKVLFETYGIEKLKVRIDRIEKEKGNKDPLFPLVTTPSQLLDKMPNVERYFGI